MIAPSATLPAAIACTSLGKDSDGVPVLCDMPVSVMAGTVNVLADKNEAGKSTLFEFVAEQLTPDRGSVALLGKTMRWSDPRVGLL